MILLDLPHPSNELLSSALAKHAIKKRTNGLNGWYAEYMPDYNVAELSFSIAATDLILQNLFNKQYGDKFHIEGKSSHFWVINFTNVNQAKGPAVFPPHTDNAREISINYIIDPGGSKVTTSIYKEKNDSPGRDTRKFNEVTLDNRYLIPTNTWVAFNSKNFHSVENIDTERTILSIVVSRNYEKEYVSYHDFERKYLPAIYKGDGAIYEYIK